MQTNKNVYYASSARHWSKSWVVVLATTALLVKFCTATESACDPLTPRQPPSSINDLRIDDFRVVMAMGDSMTAGFQASQRADMHEHRGVSFSIGGDKGAITLPNFMQEVKQNGKLVGPATGSLSLPKVKATCAGSEIDRVCRLSAAVDGSDLQDLMDLQVGYLNHTLNTATWAANISWMSACTHPNQCTPCGQCLYQPRTCEGEIRPQPPPLTGSSEEASSHAPRITRK